MKVDSSVWRGAPAAAPPPGPPTSSARAAMKVDSSVWGGAPAAALRFPRPRRGRGQGEGTSLAQEVRELIGRRLGAFEMAEIAQLQPHHDEEHGQHEERDGRALAEEAGGDADLIGVRGEEVGRVGRATARE